MATERIIESLAGIGPDSPVAAALARRSSIMALNQAAHDAVLLPSDPGGLSYAERAALAERMARHHADPGVAAHYAILLRRSGETAATSALRDPAQIPADARLAALARHADMLTLAPRDATRGAIDALSNAGVADADIVRLSELAAFVNYQIRVIAGLRLLKKAA